MKRFLSITALALLIAASGFAQSKEEKAFRVSMAKKLTAFAKKALKNFPHKAKLIYLMVISEYDPDNAHAHKALGHKRQGAIWQPTPGFKFPRVDKPNPGAAKALMNDYVKLSRELVRAHKDMARKYQKAGRTDMAQFHYKRILRFAPDDQDAKKSLDLVGVRDGLSGTSDEQEMYKRGVKIADIAKLEGAKDYPVERLEDSNRHPVLERAKVDYISVKSEHFILRGDYSEDILREAAVWSERAYRVVECAYEGFEDKFRGDTSKWRCTQFSFFKSKDTYLQILNANRHLFSSKESFEFIKEYTTGTTLRDLGVSASSSKKGVCDGAVRRVAQSYSVLGAAALHEGIGHTFVGMLLRNNRTFLVDRKEQIGTQTEEEEIARFSPDMDMWEELAIEQAWKKAQLPAVRLPLIRADKFDDVMRIKAWSFCHYLVLRDPGLLRHLSMTARFKNVIDIEESFTDTAGVSLAQLDKEWKDFFTGATPVMRAIANRKDPMMAVSKDVKKWLNAINAVRKKTFHAAPVNWSARFSTRCKDHANYLIDNKLSGPEQEQRQDPQMPGSTHEGNMFAQMAMVSTRAKDPKKLFEEWMTYPGYRDLFMVRPLKTIGIYADKNVLVLNVVQGLVRVRARSFHLYPKHRMGRIPNKVKVKDLGPELAAVLERAGHGGLKEVGFPLSLHFGNSTRLHDRDIKCHVTVNARKKAPGILHIADDGSHRRTASPGLVVFYPIPPIKKGAEVKVVWTFKHGDRLESVNATFTH